MITEEAIRLAANLLNQAAADPKNRAVGREALNPFQHLPEQRRTVVGLLRTWMGEGKLGSHLTQSDVEPLASLLVGMGPLDPLIGDVSVVSINVQAHDEVRCQRGGVWEIATDKGEPVGWAGAQEFRQFALALAARTGQVLDQANPVIQASFSNPAGRLQIDSTARTPAGVTMHIRLGRKSPITLAQMLADGGISEEMYHFLQEVARRDVGLLIVGLPGTGKTTLLEALIDFWPALPAVGLDDRSEFYPRHPLTTLYDVPAERLRQALVDALRKNITRVAVAEVRGAEAAEMLRSSGALTIWTTLHSTIEHAALRLISLVQGAEDSPYTRLSSGTVQRVIATAFPVVVEADRMIVGGRSAYFVSGIAALDRDGAPNFVFRADVEGSRVKGFQRTGDPQAVLGQFRRRIWGGVELPRLGALADMIPDAPSAVLHALGEYLRVHAGDIKANQLLRTLITQQPEARQITQARLGTLRGQVKDAAGGRNWHELLALYSRIEADPITLAVAAGAAQLDGTLRPWPKEEVARRATAVALAEETLGVAQGVQHVLAVLGVIERVKAEPDIYPPGMGERARQCFENLRRNGEGQA